MNISGAKLEDDEIDSHDAQQRYSDIQQNAMDIIEAAGKNQNAQTVINHDADQPDLSTAAFETFLAQVYPGIFDKASSIDPELMSSGAGASHAYSPNHLHQHTDLIRRVASEPLYQGGDWNSDWFSEDQQSKTIMQAGHLFNAHPTENIVNGLQRPVPQIANGYQQRQAMVPESTEPRQHSPSRQPYCRAPGQYGMSGEHSGVYIQSEQLYSYNDHDQHIYHNGFANELHEENFAWSDINHQFDFQSPYQNGSNHTNGFQVLANSPDQSNATSPITPDLAQINDFRNNQGALSARKQGEKILCAEEPCTRGARPGRLYCKRHQEKYDRNHAPTPDIPYLPNLTFERAMSQLVYPSYPPTGTPNERAQCASHEEEWVRRFLQALMIPVPEDDPNVDKFYKEQQRKFNGVALVEKKPSGRYSAEWINARMRMLFHSALVFHCGGQAVYPIGGDNGGYGKPDRSVNFFNRLAQLEDVLAKNKLIAGDVIEGRGVMALVENPAKYEKRKSQNKQSNLKKDEVLEAERKRQRDAAGEEDGDDDEYFDAREPTSPQGKPVGRRRKPTPAASRDLTTRASKRLKNQADAETPESNDIGNGQLFSPTESYPDAMSPRDHTKPIAGPSEGPFIDSRACGYFIDQDATPHEAEIQRKSQRLYP